MPTFFKRVVFRHTRNGTGFVPQYHESVLAASADCLEAAEKAFAAAISEASEPGYRLVKKWPAELLEERIGAEPVEVHSFERVSLLSPAEYRAVYESDLRPRGCGRVGWEHEWYNIDDVSSGCYNCHVRRKGRLW